jgi:hypothetical protein
MSRHSIDLPPDLEAKVAARAAEAGCESVEQYIESLIQADTGEDFGAPNDLHFENDPELESMLLQRLKDDQPSVEATPEFWNELRRRAREGRGKAP